MLNLCAISYVSWEIKTLNYKNMKIKLVMVAVLSAMVGLTACDGGDSKLAGELVGTWKGNASEIMSGRKDKTEKDDKHKSDKDDKYKGDERNKTVHFDTQEMTCTPTFTFVRTDGTNGGTINIIADYVVAKGVETLATNIPVKATVKGNVSASGKWTVKDGDEIIVNLDPSKTIVDVDTASLALSYAKLTDAPQDSLNTIKGRVASNITDVIKPMLSGRMQKMHKFDDVKITGNTMTLEAGHNKITFMKQ